MSNNSVKNERSIDLLFNGFILLDGGDCETKERNKDDKCWSRVAF